MTPKSYMRYCMSLVSELCPFGRRIIFVYTDINNVFSQVPTTTFSIQLSSAKPASQPGHGQWLYQCKLMLINTHPCPKFSGTTQSEIMQVSFTHVSQCGFMEKRHGSPHINSLVAYIFYTFWGWRHNRLLNVLWNRPMWRGIGKSMYSR